MAPSPFTDFTALTRGRAGNSFLIAPQRLCQRMTPDRESESFLAYADDLAEAFRAIAEAEPRTRMLACSADGFAMEFVQRSRVFRLPDFISVAVLTRYDGRATFALYSRARYGRYDFGVNRRRALRWVEAAAAALQARGVDGEGALQAGGFA